MFIISIANCKTPKTSFEGFAVNIYMYVFMSVKSVKVICIFRNAEAQRWSRQSKSVPGKVHENTKTTLGEYHLHMSAAQDIVLPKCVHVL